VSRKLSASASGYFASFPDVVVDFASMAVELGRTHRRLEMTLESQDCGLHRAASSRVGGPICGQHAR